MAGEGNLKCSFFTWVSASLFTSDFDGTATVCIEQPFADCVSRGDDLWRGEQAGKAASFWGKTSLCSRLSGLGLGRLKWDPCPQRSSGGPSFSLTDSAHSKNPFLFSEENSYAKHCADPSPAPFRGGGLWLALTWEQSCPLFADLFLQGLGSPKSMPGMSREEHQVSLLSWTKDMAFSVPQ